MVLVMEGEKIPTEVNKGLKPARNTQAPLSLHPSPGFQELPSEAGIWGAPFEPHNQGLFLQKPCCKGQRETRRGGDTSAPESTSLSVPLIISMVTGRYTTALLMLYSLCAF